MTLYPPSILEAVTGDTPITIHAQDIRNIIAALSPVEGIVSATDLAVTQRGAGANMSVDVAAGKALIKGDSVANQGTYITYSDATFNVPITTANATNPRIDIIVARVFDKQADGGSTYGWTLSAIAGTPAASPVAPAVPNSAIKLADVRVNAAVSSVTTGNITDRRQLSGVGDVPKWDMYGTNTTLVPNGTAQYVPAGVFQAVGVQRSGSTITIQTPGRYVVHFATRLFGNSPASDRVLLIALTSGGSVTRRISNGISTASNMPISTSGTVYMNAGDTIAPFIYHTGVATTLDDTSFETDWTGVWVGP